MKDARCRLREGNMKRFVRKTRADAKKTK